MAYPYINIWAVLLSALAFWALGALWYSLVLWMIDGIYVLLGLSIAGMILGAWS